MSILKSTAWLIAVWCCEGVALGQVEIVNNVESVSVFSGGSARMQVAFHNAEDKAVTVEVRTQLYQTTSSTAAPLDGPRVWKSLEVLPGQTILETNSLMFPEVKQRTGFLVQWLDGTNRVLGRSVVMVYPTNLLAEMKSLLGNGDAALGVLDPANELKPALTRAGIAFVDLAESRLEEFEGKLALIGPCRKSDPEWEGLSARIGKLSKNGGGVVWLQSLPDRRGGIWPSFFSVPQGGTAVVIAQPALVGNLAESPQSQLNLIYFCKLALHPEALALPDL